LSTHLISNIEITDRLEYLARLVSNRAGARLLIVCTLAKADNSAFDIRKPYTEIGGSDSYSGRSVYDEVYVAEFIQKYKLPLNSTTPFLTPAFRVRGTPLTIDTRLVGRPKRMYDEVIQLLDDIETNKVSAEDVLTEMIRWLIIVKQERESRMLSLKVALSGTNEETNLSVDQIITLIEQHMKLPRSSRLPVLIVAAAYNAAEAQLGERALPLESHNAADKQTGSLGDLEITLIDNENLITSYEMKKRVVSSLDIDHAISKLTESSVRIDNYIFITTEPINDEVCDYAKSMYEVTGVEFVILDCLSFLKHFLYLFYRLRISFLEAYQNLVLNEPESAVSHPLKEAFLAMRQAAESEG
jgi:DNA adenine methylase